MEFLDELPPQKKDFKVYDWENIKTQLLAHPGQWGSIERMDEGTFTLRGAQGVVSTIKKGQNRWLPKDQFEAAARNNIPWVKYIGGEA